MHLRRITSILAALITASALAGPVGAVPPENSVREWNQHTASAIFNPASASFPGAGYAPQLGAIYLAMSHGAVYDAVNAIEGGYQPYLAGLSADPGASVNAAAATAAHHVLVGLVPALPQATRDRLDAEYASSVADAAALESAASIDDGITVGAAAAAAMLAERAGDGRFPSTPFTFAQGTALGQWRSTSPPATDPFAWVANVRPFMLTSGSQLRSSGPLPLTSAEYAAEYNEVKALGSATGSTRTAAQTQLALFYTPNPVEMYNRAFRGIAGQQGLSPADEARFYAMVNLAGADALISCWNDKAFWAYWRPITAIREGDNDGNPATAGDPTWTSLIPSPPYPDQPSGYNCLTGAMMNTAAEFFGSKKFEFTVAHATPGGPSRTYSRFTDVVKDTIEARLCLGIHFRTPDVQGAIIGKRTSQWLDRHYFQPTD